MTATGKATVETLQRLVDAFNATTWKRVER
jgi:hypothetical protein